MRIINVLFLLCGVVKIQRHCLICVLCELLVLGFEPRLLPSLSQTCL